MVQILPFLLGEGLYGLELTRIQQLVDEAPVYYMPGAPVPILGAINLHGRILPVLDLPQLFGCESGTRSTRMIVPVAQEAAVVLAVDRVRPVLNVETPEIIICDNGSDEECVTHELDWDGQRIRLLDLDKLSERVALLCVPQGGRDG